MVTYSTYFAVGGFLSPMTVGDYDSRLGLYDASPGIRKILWSGKDRLEAIFLEMSAAGIRQHLSAVGWRPRKVGSGIGAAATLTHAELSVEVPDNVAKNGLIIAVDFDQANETLVVAEIEMSLAALFQGFIDLHVRGAIWTMLQLHGTPGVWQRVLVTAGMDVASGPGGPFVGTAAMAHGNVRIVTNPLSGTGEALEPGSEAEFIQEIDALASRLRAAVAAEGF